MEKQRTSTRAGTRPRTTSGPETDAGFAASPADHAIGTGIPTTPEPVPAPASTSPGVSQPGIVNKVKERATAQLSSQKGRATDGLDTIAHAVRQTTQQLRADDHGAVAEYIDKAAEQLERLSQRLRDKDIGELVHDARDLARRQPAVFIGGSFALGLLAARFLKSSQQDGGRSEYRRAGQAGLDRYSTGAY